jgi:hypothetical protein
VMAADLIERVAATGKPVYRETPSA